MANNLFNWEHIKSWFSANIIYILAIFGGLTLLYLVLQKILIILMYLSILIGGSR
jgi:hypothetical protein